MFESTYDAWLRYSSALVAHINEDDVRLNLDAEVRTRLKQLDLILKKLKIELETVMPNPRETERVNKFARENYERLRHNEISIDEWVAGTSLPQKSSEETKRLIEAWESITLFTESFYFFAWRLVEVLNGKAEYKFPHLEEIKARGVRLVRNHLLQHPEKPKHGQNFTQGLVVTDSGPVLRSREAVLKGGAGEVRPSDDTIDEGLYVTAAALRDEMELKLTRAAAAMA